MKFYLEKIVNQVRKARKEGFSIKKLEKKFNIPDTTISRWIRDIPSQNTLFKKARLKEKKERSRYAGIAKKLKLNKDLSKVFCSLLYWCEGSKYPSSNALTFSNSDPDLVFIFLFLLRRGFKLDEKKIKIHLQIHTTHIEKEIKKYWSNLLSIPENQFYKSTITRPTKSMKRKNYLGTCTVKYYDVKSLHHIMGIYDSLIKKWRGTQEVEGGSLLNS
ncbi:MAG: hypothetical protein COY66_02670 [Candidatus Kerfeldbacteria bacterium CG_4_10_14_0_8_um_filter_42_10]|uniref:Uncharacterized protein n=1 Tax=Candidatus Kerfeldbacteria bacterium CG_4_10_14_0_8_um_filter_42_10 TaxID=2014248 RepID=A0A2M7RJ69_9BACT|nr:MAG: hypothetical protein COY66_02670 [Candidatus Kerfeldbacteria bacterium CG_4_10_14_0_8_um_filter_42_10]